MTTTIDEHPAPAGGPRAGTRLREGPLKRIHVNQHVIRRNAKTGSVDPPITIKTSAESHRGQAVEISGPSTVVYSPSKPLACGARVWVETRAALLIS